MLTPRECLEACGAIAIVIKQGKQGCTFSVTREIVDPDILELFWIDQSLAVSVASIARNNAGAAASRDKAVSALWTAAKTRGAILTPSAVAIARARELSIRLAAHLEEMQADGRLADFNREYRRRRMAARLRSEHFMSFATAKTRLSRTLIKHLAGSKDQSAGVFLSVFSEPGGEPSQCGERRKTRSIRQLDSCYVNLPRASP
jgi:hypothetical protein